MTQMLTLTGGLQYRNGDFKQAVKILESARIGGARRQPEMIRNDAGLPIQWLLLAQCYQKLGENAKAVGFLKLAAERLTDKALSEIDWVQRFRLQSLLTETRKVIIQD